MTVPPRKQLLNKIDFYLRWKGEKRDRKRDGILRHVDAYTNDLIRQNQLQMLEELDKKLPEDKQIEFYRKNGLGTEENRQKHFRYGGYDFALQEVRSAIEEMKRKLIKQERSE